MASPRDYNLKTPEAGQSVLVISFAVGATGAVGAFAPSTRKKEFRITTPAVRTGVGVYDIFTREKWVDLLWYVANCNGAVSAVAGKTGHVTGDSLQAAAPKVTVAFVNAAGAAADPANGDQVYITLALKRGDPR